MITHQMHVFICSRYIKGNKNVIEGEVKITIASTITKQISMLGYRRSLCIKTI